MFDVHENRHYGLAVRKLLYADPIFSLRHYTETVSLRVEAWSLAHHSMLGI